MRFLLACLSLLVCLGCENSKKPKRESNLKKMTQEVFDAQVELQNKDIVEVENKLRGNDPISQSMTAYTAITSQFSTMQAQQRVAMYEVENNRYPTYEEFMKLVKGEGMKFVMLPPYQKYGYDAETGRVMVLEDKKDKAERYKKAGINEDGEWARD
ncbi:hypothetical protein [Symmachiella dynata]|uniref:hypothetical protein n=1 Tax=Symmachiella dynata TaxID=2527995 RepID=UPI0030ECA9D6